MRKKEEAEKKMNGSEKGKKSKSRNCIKEKYKGRTSGHDDNKTRLSESEQ